jgi:hypothetical protein
MSETLRQTPVPNRPLPPPTTPARHPLQLFADHGFAARLWCGVALLAVGYAIICPYFVIQASRSRERVVVLDPAGTFHVSPLLGFEEAGKLHEQHALLACLALFSRNPDGLDHPELLEKLFLTDAVKQAQAEVAATAEEFSGKHLHQKPEVLKLTVLETRENVVLVQAEGQLVRSGLFQGQMFNEAPPFKARFTLVRNPDLSANGRYPLAVWKYEVSS